MEQKVKTSKSFCVLPWIHLATHPIGTVTPCCVTEMKNGASTAVKKGTDNIGLFLSKDSLEDIANSERFNHVRKQMMDGEYPEVCKNCYLTEKDGSESKRTRDTKRFEKYIEECFKNTNPDGSLKNVEYNYVELRLGTVCNLKCTTCNPFSSNRWHQDIHAFANTEFEALYYRNDIKTEWYRDFDFYDELYSRCSNLQEIWINGGEPTMIKEHGYFLEKFIKDGTSKNIDLHYSLNCTQFPDKFIEIWKNFRNIRIHLSIDDLEKRNYYVRFPSDWDQIMTSFNKILKYRDVFNLEVCQTVSALNVFNIDNFKKFTVDNELHVAHNYVHYPNHLQVNLIPDNMKKEILDNIKFLTKKETNTLLGELNRPLENQDSARFYRFINILDKHRNVKIGDYLPEWKKYF